MDVSKFRWCLLTPRSDSKSIVYGVENGTYIAYTPINANGISPAFRIGE